MSHCTPPLQFSIHWLPYLAPLRPGMARLIPTRQIRSGTLSVVKRRVFFLDDWRRRVRICRGEADDSSSACRKIGARPEYSWRFGATAKPEKLQARSRLRRAGDAELLHPGLERRPFHAELHRGAGRTSDDPLGRLERAHDVLPLRSL